jgi:hypothetical protein
MQLWDRACAEVETRLASYKPIETDPAVDLAMRQLVIDGLQDQQELPDLPPPPEPQAPAVLAGRRGRKGRRRRAN